MNITKSIVEDYVSRGLLNKSTNGKYTLYCYNKETFFTRQWDDVTKACRGLIFSEDKDTPINHPFPKIFNLDEVPECSIDNVLGLLESEEYILCHKVNGHLTIVDYIAEDDKFLVHTKGSLGDNEMNLYDKELFYTKCSNMVSRLRVKNKLHGNIGNATFMFESINPTDKHTLYDQDSARYGDNTLVLLGGYVEVNGRWVSLNPTNLLSWANYADIPLVRMEDYDLDEDRIKDLFNEMDTEGYVIWFPHLDFRVKIKTTDYWKLRFRKELNADMIIDKFVSGGDNRLYNQYPEEIADEVVRHIEENFVDYIHNIDFIVEETKNLTNKEIGLCDELTQQQKTLIFAARNDNIVYEKNLMRSKVFRQAFKDFMELFSYRKAKMMNDLNDFMEKRGQ